MCLHTNTYVFSYCRANLQDAKAGGGGAGESVGGSWQFNSTVTCRFDDWTDVEKSGGGAGVRGGGGGGGQSRSGGGVDVEVDGFRYSVYRDDGSFASGYGHT
jgi:hypothetical protein